MAEEKNNAYEMLRLSNIERNQKFIDSLDIPKVIIPINQKKGNKKERATKKQSKQLENRIGFKVIILMKKKLEV
jgi:hypothetical protein